MISDTMDPWIGTGFAQVGRPTGRLEHAEKIEIIVVVVVLVFLFGDRLKHRRIMRALATTGVSPVSTCRIVSLTAQTDRAVSPGETALPLGWLQGGDVGLWATRRLRPRLVVPRTTAAALRSGRRTPKRPREIHAVKSRYPHDTLAPVGRRQS
jgi:hypothetical protein